MINPPPIPTGRILAALAAEYGLPAAQVAFLPLGADVNTAVYRVAAEDGGSYFLKLRRGPFEEISVTLPYFLKSQGLKAVVAPLPTAAGRLWGRLDEYRMILSPFIAGQDGYQVALTDEQWPAFGAALKHIHSVRLPPELAGLIPRETFSSDGRERVRFFQEQVERTTYADPVAARLAALMRAQRAEICHVVTRAVQLGAALQARDLNFVLCHADLHPGNLLITPGGAFYIVDWDNPILAPQERDLMFIGAGMGGSWDGERAATLFYQGYGPVQVDWMALAYYRYERIVQDFAAFGEQLLESDEGGADREQSLRYFAGNFLPGREIAAARRADWEYHRRAEGENTHEKSNFTDDPRPN